MDYIVANYRIRSIGRYADLVATAGLHFMKPFEADVDTTADLAMELRLGQQLDPTEYHPVKRLYQFTFEQEYGTCQLDRTTNGYIFTMTRTGGGTYILVKQDDSTVVASDFGYEQAPDRTLLRFGLWMMFGICIAPLGGIAIHSSVVVKDEGAVLCLGESGTGKSTHTRLWRENIEGCSLLNDDSPIIRMVDGTAMAYGSPWSGKTPCYINQGYPIRGFIRLTQAPYNKIHRLGVLNAIGALLPSCPPAFARERALEDAICDTLSQMIGAAPVYHLECLPDAAAAQLSYSTIYGK